MLYMWNLFSTKVKGQQWLITTVTPLVQSLNDAIIIEHIAITAMQFN